MSDTSPEQPLDSMHSPRGIGQIHRSGGYINRFKFQRERLRVLQGLEDKLPKSYPVKRSLPKLHLPITRLDRDDTNLSSISSKSIETIKLPAVSSEAKVSNFVRHNPPVRTLHLKLYPDHFSRIAKSLPSLPSIPGSPGPTLGNVTPEISPDQETEPEPDAKPLVVPTKNRYEVIAIQKTIHTEKRDGGKFRKHILYHLDESPRKQGYDEDGKKKEPVPIIIQSPVKYQRRYRKNDRMHGPKSDSVAEHKKWKEDCGCLRCQIIKRQYSEGDSLYKVWGEYPCHHVDPKAVADDDD